MDTGTVLAVTKTPSLYFCPVCGKPCTQGKIRCDTSTRPGSYRPLIRTTETSFTRHVQYCKRRAATKRTSRPRACRHCRTTKSKCDAQWPCSRCTSRQKECVYDKPWPTAGAAGESATVAVAESARVAEEGSQESAAGTDAGAPNASSSTSSSTSDTAAGYSSNSPATSDETSLNGPSGDNACPESCCPGLSATLPFTSAGSGTSTVALAVATPTTLSTTVASTAPMVLDPPSFDGSGISSVPNFLLSQSSGLYGLGGFSHYGNPGMGSASIGLATAQPSSLSTVHMPSPFLLHLPYAPPPDPIVEFSGGRAGPSPSAELRRLIVSMVRTFPRMMTQPGSMPPFIHRIGCGLHYEDVAAEATIPQAAAAIPLASSSSSSSSLSFPLPGGAATDTSMSMSASSYQTALFTPLPIMAACVGISHAFVTRSAHSDEFLWRAIDKEHQNIMQRVSFLWPLISSFAVTSSNPHQMESLSLGEIFVALQAVAIYTTMRLIVYGREYFFSDASLLDTMSVRISYFFFYKTILDAIGCTAVNMCSSVLETIWALPRCLEEPIHARPRRGPQTGTLKQASMGRLDL